MFTIRNSGLNQWAICHNERPIAVSTDLLDAQLITTALEDCQDMAAEIKDLCLDRDRLQNDLRDAKDFCQVKSGEVAQLTLDNTKLRQNLLAALERITKQSYLLSKRAEVKEATPPVQVAREDPRTG